MRCMTERERSESVGWERVSDGSSGVNNDEIRIVDTSGELLVRMPLKDSGALLPTQDLQGPASADRLPQSCLKSGRAQSFE